MAPSTLTTPRPSVCLPKFCAVVSTMILLVCILTGTNSVLLQPSCDGLNVSLNTLIRVKPGVNGTQFHNAAATLQGCCDACNQAGSTGCEAFFTGPAFKLCVLYPVGSVVGVLKDTHGNHTAAFRGAIPPPAPPAPPPRFPGGPLDQKLVVLTQAEADEYGAKCLDGSPPAIYYSPASGVENQNKWVLYFKGGGWCYNEAECAERSEGTLGTTTILPQFLNETWDKSSGPLHPNATLNPSFSSFHRVLLWYCDGASFSGSVDKPVINATNGKPVTLYFRGKAVLNALIGKLKKDYGLAKAEQVLLTGCSAGGYSTYAHADYVRGLVANPALTRYKVAALSGFFLDHKNTKGVPVIRGSYDYMFNMQNMSGGVNQACIAGTTANGGVVNCSTPQQNYKYISSPFFVLNSMLDAFQMGDILQVGCSPISKCNMTQVTEMNLYQHDFHTTISQLATFTKPGNGAFLYNCDLHCGEQDANGFNQIAVEGLHGRRKTIMQQALSTWWESDETDAASAHTYVESCTLTQPHACNPTCPANTYTSSTSPEFSFDLVSF